MLEIDPMADWLAVLSALFGGGVAAGALFYMIGRRVERRTAEAAARAAAAETERLLGEARQRVVLAAKEELMQAREVFEEEAARRRRDLERHEQLLEQRLGGLEERARGLELRGRALEDRDQVLAGKELEARAQLEQIAGLTAQEAKQELLRRLEDEARNEAAALARDLKEQARRNADKEAKKILALAIQRLAPESTAETTVSAVALPSDEMKGRIIGREGRNIRAFEAATGVDVIIDDTPDTVVVSCFEPVRREIARLALERLITDGRIHPGRIEEVVDKARVEVEASVLEAGEQAIYETGIKGMSPELVKLVGRMRYRTSYGQNILEHSKEVAWLAGIIAAELKLDVQLAKRGALLHDIGKVLTHEHDGTHVQLGVEVATKHGEHPTVINCIAAHHDDVAHESPISVIVQAADAVSGSRPGARREAFETYVKRLTQLEQLAGEFPGVEKVFAIQAGREVRVVVTPNAIDDGRAAELLALIERLNADHKIHGILVQLPLPKHITTQRVLHRVDPRKDVDGFHPENVGKVATGDPTGFRPATPYGVQQLLVRSELDPTGKHAVIVGRSTIVGRPMAALLLQDGPGGNATVTVCHSRTRDIKAVTRQADILIVAIGKPEFVTGDMVKPGAVVIDVGVNRIDDPSLKKGYRLVGDVKFDEVKKVAGAITPVPGGVGPMTITMLLYNTVRAARQWVGVGEGEGEPS